MTDNKEKPAAPTRPRRYRGRSTDDLRAERRERLMDAGMRLIGTEGYHALTIEKLRSSAHVSTRHFYEHFASREELLAALFEQLVAEGGAIVLQALATPAETPGARTINALRAFVRYCLNDPHKARIAFIETVGISADMERRRRTAIRRFSHLITDAAVGLADAGVVPRADFQFAAVALVGATNELIVEWLAGETGLTAEQMERAIVNLYQTLLLNPAPGERSRDAGAPRISQPGN
jgi:AcrR family transcriptional regulator